MTQKKLIEIVKGALPTISETGDAESALLKAAADNNMYPAQLEKLGHVYNQMKTLVGLEQLPSRGDSFKLLDVPAMCEKYASYDPDRVFSKKSSAQEVGDDPWDRMFAERAAKAPAARLQKSAGYSTDDPYTMEILGDMQRDNAFEGLDDAGVAAEVNRRYAEKYKAGSPKLTKMDTQEKAAGLVPSERLAFLQLDKMRERGMNVDESFAEEYDIQPDRSGMVTFPKAASAKLESEELRELIDKATATAKQASIIITNTRHAFEEHAGKVADYVMTHGRYVWPEIVKDAAHRYGASCSEAIRLAEDYMADNHVPFVPVSISKSASTDNVACDRHGMWPHLEKIDWHIRMLKEAREGARYAEGVLKEARARRAIALEKEAKSGPSNPGGNRNGGNGGGGNGDNGGSKPKDNPKPKPDGGLSWPKGRDIDVAKDMGRLDILSPMMKTMDSVGALADIYFENQEKEKKKIQDARDRANSEVTLHSLIMGDPVLSEADPNQVRSLYNSIAAISPTYATDRNLMSAALKESVQYGGIPANVIGEIAKFEDTVQKARLSANKIYNDYGAQQRFPEDNI